MNTLKIELTQEQVERALNFLGDRTYKEVGDIIETVKNQANKQIFDAENEIQQVFERGLKSLENEETDDNQ